MSKLNEAPCHDCREPTTYYLYDVPVCQKCYEYNKEKEPSNDFKNGYNSAIEGLINKINSCIKESKNGEESINSILRNLVRAIYETSFLSQLYKQKK